MAQASTTINKSSVQIGKIRLEYLILQPQAPILEIGCSIGNQARQIAALGYQVIGLDAEFALIEQFSMLARQAGLGRGQADALVGDAHLVPFPDSRFACVIATEVLEHTQEPERVLREAWRLLRQGGTLCVAVPTENTERLFSRLNPRWADYSGHIQIFRRDALLDLIRQNGFTITQFRGENFEWSLFWILFAAIRTPFDATGTATAHLLLVRIFWKAWRILNTLHLWTPIQMIGDTWLPKSVYVYARKQALVDTT